MDQMQDSGEKQAGKASGIEPDHADESTLKVKMISVQTPKEQTRQSENLQGKSPNAAMGPPTKTMTQALSESAKKHHAKRSGKVSAQKTTSAINRSLSEQQRQASSDSRASGAVKDQASNKSATSAKKSDKGAGGTSSAGLDKQASLKKSRSQSAASSMHSKSPISPGAHHSASSPPKLQQSSSLQPRLSSGAEGQHKASSDVKSAGGGASGGVRKTTVVTRKIKVGSSTKKKLGSSSAASGDPSKQQHGENKKTRTTIIKKVIRKKKISKSGGKSQESITSSKIVKTSSHQSSASKTVVKSGAKAGGSTPSNKQLKLKSQRSQDSSGKPPRPPILLSEAEEQFRWILKPFATVDDQKTWRDRFMNLLAQREQAHTDPERKEPPCMACYTRLPDLVKQVIQLTDQDDEDFITRNDRLSPTDASWLTMHAFCKRCCNNKQQLTGAHLSCLGMRHRGFQLLDLTPQMPQGSKRRILLFECDLCSFARSKKGVSGGDSAVRKFATCLICRRRNWSNQENPGSLMRKLMPISASAAKQEIGEVPAQPNATPAIEEEKQHQQQNLAPVGVHAICAALFGKQRGIVLLDAVQMLYGYTPEVESAVEEQKEAPPKCDICKVTIKRAGKITVKCCGVDIEEVRQLVDDEELSGDEESRHSKRQQEEGERQQQPDDSVELKVVPCNKYVHSSCLMERSKWKACVTGQNVRGFCRTHEAQHKLVMPEKNRSLMQLLKANRIAYFVNQTNSDASEVQMEYLVAKLWFSQAGHALRAPASEQLLARHVELATSHLLFDFVETVQQLTEKQSIVVAEPTEQITALLGKARPQEIYVSTDAGDLVISQEKKESNEVMHGQINKFLSECLQKCSLLKGHLLELYVRGNEHYALSRGLAMLCSPEKSLLFEEVRQVLGFLEELNLKEFIVYARLKAIYEVQKEWRAKVTKILSSSVPSIESLTMEMRSYRHREKGVALVQTRLTELKRLFAEKPPVDHFIALLNEDMEQKVFDNMQYIERLTQKYLWITEFDNMPQTLQQMQCQPKPVKNLYQTLLLLACQPLRANQYEQLLGVWQHSCLWQAHARSFIALHSNPGGQSTLNANGNAGQSAMIVDWENNESSQEPMDIDEAIEVDNRLLGELKDQEQDLPRITGQLSKHIEQCAAAQMEQQDSADNGVDSNGEEAPAPVAKKPPAAPTRMFFTDADIDELLSQPCADPADFSAVKFVYDKGLCERVWHRANALRKLKAKLENVAQECHQIDEITEYIKDCKAQTNFDLSHEAEVAKEKLCLMQDALKTGQINNQEDQGLVASEVYSRVQQLKERDADKIRIPEDLEMMLQAKVQISEKLRRDFYDILEKGKGADSFNKEQMQNLRNIVQKATKDHGLQMEQENKIVDNLKNSEAWLDGTFRSLRSSCGPALNQIDFKDFQQLHSIFQSAKDCELLLKKHVHSKMDNLVGAAKNLYMSLLRAKWLFDVKNLMDKATGTKDLAQLLCLYNRAKELEIDFDKTQSSAVQEQEASAIYNLAKQRLHDQQQSQENMILKEFSRLGKVSSEFDQLFGTHLKIISTLEKHEKEDKMEDLKKIVEKLQADLQQTPASPTNDSAPEQQQQAATNPLLPPTLVKRESQFGSRVFAISTANELEILTKVRDYIRLNENYNEYMLLKSSSTTAAKPNFGDQQQQQVKEAAGAAITTNKVTNETEVQVAAKEPDQRADAAEESKQLIDTSDKKEQKVSPAAAADATAPNPTEKQQPISKQETTKKQKISYQKAMELQRQAREQQIPDDIPVLKRLNQSVQRFEKFRRLCTDYYRFRDKIKQKGAELLTSNSALIGQKQENRPKLLTQSSSSLQQNNSDTKFSLAFLKRLLIESEEIEIEVPKEQFNKERILEQLALFQQWRQRTEQTLKQLEKELSYSSANKPENLTDVITEQTRKMFEDAKLKIKELPVFDNETFMRIQAFEWLLTATSLIQGQHYKSQLQPGGNNSANQGSASAEKLQLQQQQSQQSQQQQQLSIQSQRIYSLTFWEQLFRQHENYLKVLPMLEDHPIIQNILWEMDRAKSIVEFVKITKKKIQSNQGKFLSDRYYNYVAFKDKQDPSKIRKLLEQAQSTRVDISEETQALKEWLRAYERYTQMDENGTLYTGNNYEKIKQIYKNIYLSPLDFGELYFEIGRRLEIANEIKADIKLITEENQIENGKKQSENRKRISLSRFETDLNHFRMNCQIPGIFEIDRVIKQIATSRVTIQECKEVIMTAMAADATIEEQIQALDKARKIQCLIEIDMEDEETEIRKLMFQKNLSLIQAEHIKINVQQYRTMQQEYKEVLKQELNAETIAEYKDFSESVTMCLKLLSKCPTKDLLDNEVREKVEELCPQVDFEQMFIDRAAQLYHMQQKKQGPFGGIGNLEGSIEDDDDGDEEGEAEMSESKSVSASQGSQVSKSGKDSRNVSSSSQSDSDSDSGSSSSGSSSGSSSSEQSKKASNESSSSGESEEVLKPSKTSLNAGGSKPAAVKPTKTVSKEPQKDGEGEQEEDDEEMANGEKDGQDAVGAAAEEEDESDEGGESEQEENAESASKEEASDPSAESQKEALANRRPKRKVKANKMDDHIYYNNRQSGGAGGGSSTLDQNGVKPSKRRKLRQGGSSESEERASKSEADEDDEEEKDNEAELKRKEEQQKKKRQLKKERKEAKAAEKCFEKQKEKQQQMREKRKMQEMSPMDSDMALNISQDQELQSRLKSTQDRIRNKSKTQIYDVLAKFDKKYFAVGGSAKDDGDLQYSIYIKSVMQQLEGHIFSKNSQVGAQYQSKVGETLVNLNLLASEKYRDLAELFFLRKTINYMRFTSSCVAFSEFIEKINKQRIERRQRHQQMRKQQSSLQPQKPAQSSQQLLKSSAENRGDVSVPEHQKLLPLAYPANPERVNRDLSKHAFPNTKQEPTAQGGGGGHTPGVSSSEEQPAKRATLTRHDSQASIDSLESNPAKFSDDGEEDIDPFKQAASGLTMGATSKQSKRSSRHRSSISAQKVIMPVPCIMQIPQFKYNPYSIVQATKHSKQQQSMLGGGSSMFDALPGLLMPPAPMGPSKTVQILYNPIKSAGMSQDGKGQSQMLQSIKIRNVAAPGSLLKVWEGTLDVSGGANQSSSKPGAGSANGEKGNSAKNGLLDCQLFSVGDIRQYQGLPEFPTKLGLKGKSKIAEVTSHFKKLRQEMANQKHGHSSSNMLLKGWVTRKNLSSQDNSDKYTKHYETLEQTQRCDVFTLFEGVSVYLIPITSQTKDFCRQMGIYPLKGKDQGANKDNNLNNPEESSILDETHYYAFLSQVRQSFTKRSSYQNPEVICHAHDMPKLPAPPAPAPKQSQPPASSTALKNEKMEWGGNSIDAVPVGANANSGGAPATTGGVSDPRFQEQQSGKPPSVSGMKDMSSPPTTINLIHAAPNQPAIKREMVGYNQVPVYAGDEAETIYVDEDDVRIDALIEKFRAQEDPNIDEIQRELKPLLESQTSGRREEKLVSFLRETIEKVQARQQRLNNMQDMQMQQEPQSSMMQPHHQQQQEPPSSMMQQHHQQPPYSSAMHMGYDSGMPPQSQSMYSGGYPPQQQDMQMQFGGGDSFQHQRYDQQPPPYGMQGPNNYQHSQMMQGRMPPVGQPAPPQSHMQSSMDNQMTGMPGMLPMGAGGANGPPQGVGGPPSMRLPPTSFPQQPSEYQMVPPQQHQYQQFPYPPPGQPRPPQGGNGNQNDGHHQQM